MKRIKMLIQQFFRFGIVGILSFGIDYGLLILLTDAVGFEYIYSSAVSYGVSVLVNYFLSMRFVFQGKEDRNKFLEAGIFVFLSMIGLLFNQMIMLIAVESLGVHYKIAKLLATMTVTVYNFISRKVFME